MSEYTEQRPFERVHINEALRPTESLVGEFRNTASGISEALGRRETYESQEKPLIESLKELLATRFEDLRNFAGALETLGRTVLPHLGSVGEAVGTGIELVKDVFGRGEAWLKEHPQFISATLEVLLLVSFAIFDGAGFLRLVTDRPDLITSRIDALAKAIT